ncbi:EAL domain-containing protein [Streptomyces sp. AJS327]|nr:EAL domain-containing protein [Streptomyces sp. AJS327]
MRYAGSTQEARPGVRRAIGTLETAPCRGTARTAHQPSLTATGPAVPRTAQAADAVGTAGTANTPWRPATVGDDRARGTRLNGALPQLCLAAVCAAYAVGAALGWGSPRIALVMGDFGLAGAALIAAVSCLWYARTRRDHGTHRPQRGHAEGPSRRSDTRPAWLLFGVSSLMVCLGNAIWGWHEVVRGEPVPQPSLADFCFLLFAPPAIVGLLVLAKRPVTRAGWVCLGLDAWLIGGSLLTLSWSLALAHTAPWEDGSVARAALNLAYPLLDIVLVSMVLALHFRRNSAHRSAVNTAVGALALTVLCDAMFTSPLLREHYASGQLLDAGWFAGSLLLAYAPWVGVRESAADAVRRPVGTTRANARRGAAAPGRGALTGAPGRADEPGRPLAGSLAALTPYLAAAVCTLGILYNSLDGQKIDRVVLFTGCAVVLALVVRQGIMLLDNITLTHELARQESHFRSLVQGSSDVIMIAAADGTLRYVSPAAAGVYGRDADRLVGTELRALIHAEDLSGVLHELRRFLAAPSEQEPSTRIECRFRHGDGHWLNIESTVNRYQGGLIFNSRDVTERVRLQAQLQHSASHDALTDLPNRALFTERVRGALAGRRGGDGETAVLFIDLDGFKAVNDTHGHQAGDELLVHAARRLRESVRAGDTAARLGGDEFAVLIVGGGDTAWRDAAERELRIHEIADRLRLTLSEPYLVEGTEMRVAASIGIAFAEPGISPASLMRNADLAMYRAKQAGKGRVELYAPQMQAEVVQRAELTVRLRSALHDGEFTVLHQPIVELSSGKVTAVAAQARWRSPQGLLLTPEEFLRSEHSPARGEVGTRGGADRGGEVDRWLLEEAVEQAVARHAAGLAAPVSVRIPASLLADDPGPAAATGIEALISRSGLPSGALILGLYGIDERVPLDTLERRLATLRRMGVCIALDGAGGGGDVLPALRRLPVDILRLDRGLVAGLTTSARQRKITAGLLRMAADLGVATVADGVDMPEQAAALREMGCSHAQGVVFSGPLEERRLRGALLRGVRALPETAPPSAPRPNSAPARAAARSMVVAGSLPLSGAVPMARSKSGPARPGGSGARSGPGGGRPGAGPARQGGPGVPEAVRHTPVCSNAETSVPPT